MEIRESVMAANIMVLKFEVVTFCGMFCTIHSPAIFTASLAKGSFTSDVLKHPTRFTPSPQILTAATTASGPGSKVQYTDASTNATAVFGISGTASN